MAETRRTPRVLLILAEPRVRASVALALQRKGIDCATAASCQDATRIGVWPPRIVLDGRLPTVDTARLASLAPRSEVLVYMPGAPRSRSVVGTIEDLKTEIVNRSQG